MNKLKNEYIDKMIEQKLSSKEVDFLLYIARYQSTAGTVYSAYYKDVCDAIHISHQKFYDILMSLEQKGLIQSRKENKADYCITLVGNDFLDKNFSKGYLNVAAQDFQKAEFASLKAGAKLLYLYMQRCVQGHHEGLKNFYNSFCKRFHCTKKTLQEYLRALNVNYFVISKRKRNQAYNYEICLNNGKTLHLKKNGMRRPGACSENELYQSNIRKMLLNNFKRYLPENVGIDNKILIDIAGLVNRRINNKLAAEYKDFPLLIVAAVKSSLNLQIKEGNRPRLNAALVNRCLTERLDYGSNTYF